MSDRSSGGPAERHDGEPSPRLSRRGLLYLSAVTAVAGAAATRQPSPARPASRWLATGPHPGALPGSPPAGHALVAPAAARTRPVYRVPEILPGAAPSAIALTIDDGPDPQWTPEVLALLARHRITATFSLIGRQVLAHPDLARRISGEGHAICNHTMTHPLALARGSARSVRDEVHRAQSAIADAVGAPPRLLRAPAGSWSPTVLAVAAESGLCPVDWTVDPRDWTRPGARRITRRMLMAKPGDIVLCHDGGGNRAETIRALSAVLPVLLDRGYTFLSL